MYDAGVPVTDIVNELNSLGLKTTRNGSFHKNSITNILKNEKYIGVYDCAGIRIENGIPPIIDKELFLRAKKRLDANRQAPARGKSRMKYLLSGKLYCAIAKME